jgi:transcriptional regulator of acetoin/glycerol metabolism
MEGDKSSTLRDGSGDLRGADDEPGAPEPGLVKIFAGGAACFELIALGGQQPLTLGRQKPCGAWLDDARASRCHAEILFTHGRWIVRDLESQNGTFLDGVRITGIAEAEGSRVLTIGGSVLLLEPDVRPLRGGAIELGDGVVVGPRLGLAWQAIRRAASGARTLHITGETGTGKELAARLFHSAGPRAQQPLVAVNCAAIPPPLAESLLFGARKGAYSGAEVSSEGYLATANGGTLLLDEIGELSLEVQAKLLRALDGGEILPLGASRPVKINLAICSATHLDLRERVGSGAFRQDLYFRIGHPRVALPPLRERREEIPWIVQARLSRSGRAAHPLLIEAALLRPWPGNVRELINEIDAAAHLSAKQRLDAKDLAPHAGTGVTDGAAGARVESPPAGAQESPEQRAVLDALLRAGGNVSEAARVLGWHRTRLRRWLMRPENRGRRG